jgi:hypothetical protein
LRFSGLISGSNFVVFLGSSCRETAKNAIKKPMGKDDREKGKKISTFPANGQKFLTWTSPKTFFVVFLNSPSPSCLQLAIVEAVGERSETCGSQHSTTGDSGLARWLLQEQYQGGLEEAWLGGGEWL